MESFFEAIREIWREYWIQITLGIVVNLVAAFFILTFTNWKAALCMIAVAIMLLALFIIARMVGRADEM